MEPEEASCRLHTQEVAGSSPVAPTIRISNLPPATPEKAECPVSETGLGRPPLPAPGSRNTSSIDVALLS
jgi:hypothetical protein